MKGSVLIDLKRNLLVEREVRVGRTRLNRTGVGVRIPAGLLVLVSLTETLSVY